MSKDVKEERLRWILPIAKKQVRLVDVAKMCPYGKRTLERWLALYRQHGEAGLEPKSTRPKTNPNETPIHIKERAIALRKEKGECALKLSWDLADEGISLHHQTVHKIIKQEGLTRKYRVRRVKYKYLKAELKPGELVEIDVKYVPGKVHGRRYFQYTAADVASRWRHIEIYDDQITYHSIIFLKEVIQRASFTIKAIKTDNHSTFTNRYTGYEKSADPLDPKPHPLDIFCAKHSIDHYLIDKGKPDQNGTVERSHRSDQERLYNNTLFKNTEELRYRARLWNMYYNNLKHCGLNGKSPNQFLQEYYQLSNPPKVCI